MSESEPVVKWLFPGAQGDNTSLGSQQSDMESEVQTDQSVQGSIEGQPSEVDKSTPTSSGCDSETGFVDEIPEDEDSGISKDLSNKMTAASNYMGSFFSSSSWSSSAPKKSPEEEVQPEQSVTKSSTMTSSFFSAFSKVGMTKSVSSGVGEGSQVEEGEGKSEDGGSEAVEAQEASSSSTSSFFSSAFSKIGLTSREEKEDKVEEKKEEGKTEDKQGEEEAGESFFSSAFSRVGKAATSATKVLRDGVSNAPMLAEFNQEQEEFIKNKEKKNQTGAPWIGYQNEDELKEKILALSEDKRNFVRAPPTGVNFDFEYASFAASAVTLLEEDSRLQKMRYELVPKKVKEDEFWRNYFYRVAIVKQSFELSESMSTDAKKDSSNKMIPVDDYTEKPVGQDHDDEFVSESHQASSKDLAEADEAMKKLGIAKDDAEWEAELEGELNEYEMVGEDEDQAENPEWENQIKEMLEADAK